MSAPFWTSTTPLQWLIVWVRLGSLNIPTAHLDVELFLRSILPGRHVVSEQTWLDTGAPLSVIPFHVHNGRLNWKPVPGVTVTWAGQVCDLGYLDFWLPTEQSPTPRGPFTLLAKFARAILRAIQSLCSLDSNSFFRHLQE